jgi:hypothetical protein
VIKASLELSIRNGTLIHSYIENAKNLFELKHSKKVKFYIAVDYSLIHSYLYFPISQLFASETYIREKLLLEHISKRFLFEKIPIIKKYIPYAEDRPLILLPPYLNEMTKVISKKTKRQTINYFRRRKLLSQLDHISRTKEFNEIIKKNRISEDDYSAIALLFEKLYDLSLYLSGTHYDNSRNIIKNKNHLFIHLEDLPTISHDELDKDNIHMFFKQFSALRKDPWNFEPNYTDSEALEYVSKINSKITADNKRLILVTDSEAVIKVAQDSKLSFDGCPLACHPMTLIVFLLCIDNDPHNIARNLSKFADELPSKIRKHIDTLVNYKKFATEKDLAEEVLGEYIQGSSRNITRFIRSFMLWDLFDKSFTTTNSALQEILNDILLDVKDLHAEVLNRLKDIFTKNISDILLEMLEKELVFTKALSFKFQDLFATTHDSYFFNEILFDDFPAVQKISVNILSDNTALQVESVKELFDLVKKRDPAATLLLLVLMEKSGEDDIKTTNRMIKYLEHKKDSASQNLLYSYYFLQNLFLSRNDNKIINAFKRSFELAKMIGSKQPRFWLQAGYLSYKIWDTLENNIVNLQTAIDYTENACEFAKEEERYLNCLSLSYANLALFYHFHKNSYKADKSISELKHLLEYNPDVHKVPLFLYAEATILLSKIETVKAEDNENYMKQYGDLSKLIKEMKSYKTSLTRFARNKHKLLIERFDRLPRPLASANNVSPAPTDLTSHS